MNVKEFFTNLLNSLSINISSDPEKGQTIKIGSKSGDVEGNIEVKIPPTQEPNSDSNTTEVTTDVS